VGVLELLEQVGADTAEKHMPAVGAEQLGVVGEDDEPGCAERGAAAEPEHDHGQLGSGRVRQARLQCARAREQQASVDVQDRDLVAGRVAGAGDSTSLPSSPRVSRTTFKSTAS
jgi:hypothetical protein